MKIFQSLKFSLFDFQFPIFFQRWMLGVGCWMLPVLAFAFTTNAPSPRPLGPDTNTAVTLAYKTNGLFPGAFAVFDGTNWVLVNTNSFTLSAQVGGLQPASGNLTNWSRQNTNAFLPQYNGQSFNQEIIAGVISPTNIIPNAGHIRMVQNSRQVFSTDITFSNQMVGWDFTYLDQNGHGGFQFKIIGFINSTNVTVWPYGGSDNGATNQIVDLYPVAVRINDINRTHCGFIGNAAEFGAIFPSTCNGFFQILDKTNIFQMHPQQRTAGPAALLGPKLCLDNGTAVSYGGDIFNIDGTALGQALEVIGRDYGSMVHIQYGITNARGNLSLCTSNLNLNTSQVNLRSVYGTNVTSYIDANWEQIVHTGIGAWDWHMVSGPGFGYRWYGGNFLFANQVLQMQLGDSFFNVYTNVSLLASNRIGNAPSQSTDIVGTNFYLQSVDNPNMKYRICVTSNGTIQAKGPFSN